MVVKGAYVSVYVAIPRAHSAKGWLQWLRCSETGVPSDDIYTCFCFFHLRVLCVGAVVSLAQARSLRRTDLGARQAGGGLQTGGTRVLGPADAPLWRRTRHLRRRTAGRGPHSVRVVHVLYVLYVRAGTPFGAALMIASPTVVLKALTNFVDGSWKHSLFLCIL